MAHKYLARFPSFTGEGILFIQRMSINKITEAQSQVILFIKIQISRENLPADSYERNFFMWCAEQPVGHYTEEFEVNTG
ncbi:MAG TPA: hypothetical protein DD738_14340 [Ruminiclostridium sp.]|jgi:hypothetical protein|nr:hypothetical protein [Ruminiclostridium sp.]